MVNAQSRRGRTGLNRAVALLSAAGLAVRPVIVHDVSQANALLRAEVAREAPYVIVGGGDGTLSHAAGILARSRTALAVMPLGTGNSFARSVGVPLDLAGAARLIADGTPTQVDVGLVNGRVFLNSVALGLSAEIARSLTPGVKRHLGLMAWPVVGSKVLWRHRALHLNLTSESGAWVFHTHQLLVANGRYVAGPLRATPLASVADSQLDILVFGNGSLVSLLQVARWASGGKIRHITAHQLSVVSRTGDVWASVDGEVFQTSELRLTLAPQALGVLVPADFDARSV